MQPSPPKSLVILGGGTAGWMAASIFLHAWKDQGVKITLIESRDIGTIGVGEGSTPALRKFFSYLRIAEKDWMPACNATYKAGIYFNHWSTRPGYESYFHPFYTAWDKDGAHAFVAAVNSRRQGSDTAAHPNAYFLAQQLAQANKSPRPMDKSLGSQVDYGYHFDAGLLGNFLRERAKTLGLSHVIGTVEQVIRQDNGDIAAVATAEQGQIAADFFIDCTGFAGLLINKTLQEPFISYKENLFNDAAVTLPTAIGDTIPPATHASALSSGWAWKIPLTNRYGNGYVYSSDFISPEQAEQELRQHLGAAAEGAEARHLKMRVGRIANHWKNNCLAVGLAQGFIEPLEATALAIVQSTLENFVDCFDKPVTAQSKAQFNQYINQLMEGIRDYIVTHYLLNTRNDSAYWRVCREQASASPQLRELFACWDKGEDFLPLLFAQQRQRIYKPESWYCIFAGMGRFTPAASANTIDANTQQLQHKLQQLSHTYFLDHRAQLTA